MVVGVESPSATLKGLLRVVFLRGSPERIFYTRRRFIVCLLLAVLLSGLAQAFFYQDHLVFVVLRVFAELTMFMLAIVLLTAKIARFRLAYMMLVLVMISALMDTTLLAIAPILTVFADAEAARLWVGWAIGAMAAYGAANCFAWGLRRDLLGGAVVVLLYLAASLALDLAFRGLYDIMAAG